MDFNPIFSQLRAARTNPSPANTEKVKDYLKGIPKGLLSRQSEAIILNLAQNLTGRIAIFDQYEIHEATLLFQKIQILHQFLRKHRGCNHDLIKKIVDLTFPLMDECDCTASQTILETCLRFSETDIKSLAVLGPPLMKGLRDPEQKVSLIQAIKAVPLNSRKAICREVLPLISKTMGGFYRIQLLRKIETMHQETRPFICETLLKLIEGAREKEIIDIIDTLTKLDDNDLSIINARSFEFAEKVTSEGDRCVAIKKIITDFENLTSFLPAWSRAFIKTFPEKDIQSFQTLLNQLLENLYETGNLLVFVDIITLPKESIVPFCLQVHSWTNDQFTFNNIKILFDIMKAIPNDEREALCQSANADITKQQKPATKLLILETLNYFPPTEHSNLLPQIINKSKETTNLIVVISKILKDCPELKESLHSHLLLKLKKEDIPLIDRFQLATFIIANGDRLQLKKSDPLFLEAGIFIDQDKTPQNPYAVFKKVIDSAKLDTPSAPFQDGIKLCPKQIFVDARPFIPQSEVLAITHGTPLTGQVLQNFISTFRERIRKAPNKEAIEASVTASNEASLAKLLENLEDTFFSELLNQPFQDPLPLKQAVMCSLIQFFLDLSNEVPEGALLSPREEALCKVSSSIKHCSQGKSEGLILVYTYFLPENYRYHIESDINIVAKAKAFVRTTLQNTIMNQLSSDSPMMQAMTGSDGQVKQLSHQSTYVKNLLAPHTGMPHSLEFDRSTQTLYTSLFTKSLQEIFALFYTHFTVKSAIESLKTAFNQLPQTTKGPIYNGIVHLLEHRIGSGNIFNLDEETGSILSLQDNAAKELLIVLGIGELA